MDHEQGIIRGGESGGAIALQCDSKSIKNAAGTTIVASGVAIDNVKSVPAKKTVASCVNNDDNILCKCRGEGGLNKEHFGKQLQPSYLLLYHLY